MIGKSRIPRLDRRQTRASQMVGAVMHIIGPHLRDDKEAVRGAYEGLMDAFHTMGVEVLTDHTREQLGLSPRSGDGWTMEEIIAMEQKMLDIMSRPAPSFLMPGTAPHD